MTNNYRLREFATKSQAKQEKSNKFQQRQRLLSQDRYSEPVNKVWPTPGRGQAGESAS